jgi:ABC-type transporter Mla subunit MlaD
VRRAAVIGLLLAAVVAVVIVVATSGGGDTYRVRAIFDNAGFVIPGEDVKVAGVKVGKISDLDVTEDFKAVVVLEITDPGYQDFRQDAECEVRPQSLIGERFVECSPTQAHAAGEQPAAPLERIEDGPGKGQYLLPVERTSKAVDIDLINDVMRRPERERLSIILAELGTGLAGRGEDLDAVIRRANPALKEVDEVLEILASQNRTLERLAVDSDQVLAPLARERRHVSSALANSAEVAEATAERRAELEAGLQRLPAFLRELRPTMTRLGALSDEMTPVLTDLGAAAPSVNRLIIQLGPFSTAAVPAFESLGEAAEIGTPAVTDARPVIADLRRVARSTLPVARSAANILTSLRRTDGVERLMDYIFYQVAAINGFDSLGHYLRAGLIVNACSSYAVRPAFGCSANFSRASSSSAPAETAQVTNEPELLEESKTPIDPGSPPPPETEAVLDYLFGSDGE